MTRDPVAAPPGTPSTLNRCERDPQPVRTYWYRHQQSTLASPASETLRLPRHARAAHPSPPPRAAEAPPPELRRHGDGRGVRGVREHVLEQAPRVEVRGQPPAQGAARDGRSRGASDAPRRARATQLVPRAFEPSTRRVLPSPPNDPPRSQPTTSPPLPAASTPSPPPLVRNASRSSTRASTAATTSRTSPPPRRRAGSRRWIASASTPTRRGTSPTRSA